MLTFNVVVLAFGIAFGRIVVGRSKALNSIFTARRIGHFALLLALGAGWFIPHVVSVMSKTIDVTPPQSSVKVTLFDSSFSLVSSVTFAGFSLALATITFIGAIVHLMNEKRITDNLANENWEGDPKSQSIAVWPSVQRLLVMLWIQFFLFLVGISYFLLAIKLQSPSISTSKFSVPPISIPKHFFECDSDQDCEFVHDSCRSCGPWVVVNRKYVESVEKLNRESWSLASFGLRVCEACWGARMRPVCVEGLCGASHGDLALIGSADYCSALDQQ